MRKYEMIFFDWDGTAVESRAAPADAVANAMAPLLAAGVKLAAISGTSLHNIDGGKFAQRFEPQQRRNLYFGLDRGVNNYCFDICGNIIHIPGVKAGRDDILALHKVCFDFHLKLLKDYSLNTDIVFCRDEYCKIDIGSNISRGSNFFFTGDELDLINIGLRAHGYSGGIRGLIALAESLGREYVLPLKVTTDAKYIEMGFGTKSDNVDAILSQFELDAGSITDCFHTNRPHVSLDAPILVNLDTH